MLKLRDIVTSVVILLTICSCNKASEKVNFDYSFKGARLDSVISVNANSYKLLINPAFEPVNKSPYYAFSIISNKEKLITVEIDYGEYKHRYIPKLSSDRVTWEVIKSENIAVDTISGKAKLKLKVSQQKLYVSAQEIETSQDTYKWVNSIVKKHSEIKKVIAGKTALKEDLYVLETEKSTNNKAIVLIARQHPPETPGGTIGFKAFYEELMSNNTLAKEFRKQFNIYAFPLLNPDGADMGNWRHNANGADLNRDWVDFKQPETQVVKSYISKKIIQEKALAFAIDFHTSYSGPYLLVLDSLNAAKVKGVIPRWIENIEQHSSFEVESRKRSQELPYCYNYFYNTYGCEAVTYEEGDEIDRNIIKQRAELYAKQLMKTMILKYANKI